MSIEVFNRYEKKFMIDSKTYEVLQDKLSHHMEMDAFNQANGYYTICNIYYDTEVNEIILKSMAKPNYKEKLRLRTYGIPNERTIGYLEIKKKYNGLVNKRRTKMSLKDADSFVRYGLKPEVQPTYNKQVINEIDFLIKRYPLVPTVYIAYDRAAFFSKENKDLRITFDMNIRTRRYELNLEAGDHGDLLINPEFRIMEIKAEKAFPLWLSRMLSDLKLYPTSFSKYASEYVQYHKSLQDKNVGRSYEKVNEPNDIKKNNEIKGDIILCSNPYLQQQPQPHYL